MRFDWTGVVEDQAELIIEISLIANVRDPKLKVLLKVPDRETVRLRIKGFPRKQE